MMVEEEVKMYYAQLLKGKRCVVTGGTSGIGRAIAELYATSGADVIVMGTNEERGQSVLASMQGSGEFAFMKIDVASYADVKKALDEIHEKWGSIDVLVNCAGVTVDRMFLRMTEEDWDKVLNTNLKSVYNFCHGAIKAMLKARKGRIINISSVVGLIGNAGQVNYSASKAGMIGMTRSLAKEVASRGITVNCIAPGMIKTRMTDAIPEKAHEELVKGIPLGKMGDPMDIANAALYLASDMGGYVTGQTLVVDGGMTS